MSLSSKVCVIGGGVSGLLAVKYCLEYGLSVVCYEERSQLGGVWTSCKPEFPSRSHSGRLLTSVHDLLLLNTSQFVTTFSDFPLPADLIPGVQKGRHYLNGEEFLDYIGRFVDTFRLRPHVQLNCEVVNVCRHVKDSETWEWLVTVRRLEDGRTVDTTTRHQFVIIASGMYRTPFIPEIPGMETSPVKCVHTAHVRDTRKMFENKKVIVIGSSISGADMMQAAVMAGASKVTWAIVKGKTARTVCLIARYPFFLRWAWDEWFSLFGSLYFPAWLDRLIVSLMSVYLYRASSDPLDLAMDRLPVQDTDILSAAQRSGQLVVVKTTVSSLCSETRQARMADGSVLDVDVVVLGTGYVSDFPFLDEKVVEKELSDLSLFRSVLMTDACAWGLSVLYSTPIGGSGIGSSEMEARWLCHKIAAGELVAESERKALAGRRETERTFLVKRRRFCTTVANDLAADIGCLPSLLPLLLSPSARQRRLGLALVVGPWLPQHFRLRGPHAVPAMTDIVIGVNKRLSQWRWEAMSVVVDLLGLGVTNVIRESVMILSP